MLNGITNKRWLIIFQILKTKKDCPNGAVYQNCRLFPTLQTLLSSDVKVGAAIVGTPPYTRGTFEDGKYYTTFLKKCSKTCLSVWTYNETRANLHYWIVRRSHFPDKDLELKLAEAGIHTFCEKPLTSLEPEEFANYSKTVSDSAKKKGIVLSIRYMFRYEVNLVPSKNILSLTLLIFFSFSQIYTG